MLSFIPAQTNVTNTRTVFNSCIWCNEFCLSERLIRFRNKTTDLYQIWYGISILKLSVADSLNPIAQSLHYIKLKLEKKIVLWHFFTYVWVLNDAFSRQTMKRRFGMKWPWPNRGICMEGLRKATNILSQDSLHRPRFEQSTSRICVKSAAAMPTPFGMCMT
jgi:hypothetical protein